MTYDKLLRIRKCMISTETSFVIPMYNEEGNVEPLLTELVYAIKSQISTFEIILVDDQSIDGTFRKLNNYKESNPDIDITIMQNNKNSGQGISVYNGCKNAKYESTVIMDGDLQVNPLDIIKLYQYMFDNKLDFVCSKRKTRADDIILRHMPSMIGNVLIRLLFKAELIDIGSSLKIIPKSKLLKVEPFRNFHRYVSIFLHHQHLSYSELEVEHRSRNFGSSNYSVFKFAAVIGELFVVNKHLKKMTRLLRKEKK